METKVLKAGGFVGSIFLVLSVVLPTMLLGQPNTLPTNEVRQSVCLNGTWNITPEGGTATTIQVPATWRHGTGAVNNIYYNFTYPTTWQGGTYSRTFTLPGNMPSASMVIKTAFNSVRYGSQVSVNGTQVGTNNDGFLPFEFKVNGQLNGGTNTLTVHVDNASVAPIGLSGGYDAYRGIWQDVYLKAYPLVYVDNTFFVKTSYRNNNIATDVPVRNEDTRSRTIYIKNFVTDASGAIVLMFQSGPNTLAAGANQTYSFNTAWANPHYWIPEDPYLYTIHTVIYDQDQTTVVDWKKTRFGFKEVYLIGAQLYLNGKKAFFRGDSHHYQGEYQQTRQYYEALFTAMKEWGCNYYRPHTLPYDPVIYDVADSMGMMIDAETAIYGSDGDADCNADYLPHVQRFIERDRNHPSVAIWSCSNEVNWKAWNPNARVDFAETIDPTRVPYAEENGWTGKYLCSIHYYDFDHCGAYATVPNPPTRNTTQVQTMGEYCNYMISCFGNTGTGACGYETSSQDYGTGYWTHGETAMGQTRGLQSQRLYQVFCSWSIYWFACRTQPFFNNAATYTYNWPSLTTPGAKPQIIKSCEHTINWVDQNLPVYNPLPWFYLYVPYYQAIRCTDLMPHSTVNNCNFYSGATITRNFDLWYESFQNATHMRAEVVRKSDNAVLSTTDMTGAPWNNIQAGTTYTGLTVNWTAPTVTAQTPVYINRTFYNGTTKQSTCSFEGNIFPRFAATHVSGLSGKRVALFDPNGATKTILDNIGLTYTSVAALSSVTSAAYDVLVIGSNNATTGLDPAFVINGGRVLCLAQTAKPSLPINLPAFVALAAGSTQKDVQFLLNGAKHTIFNGLDQNDLSYWANNANTEVNVYDRPTTTENIRVLCAANNAGDYAPILEVPAGRGTYLLCQMEIVPQYANEPVAGKLLVNMLNYLGAYVPLNISKTGLIADAGAVKTYYDGLPLRYDATLTSANFAAADLSTFTVLVIDGSSATIAATMSANAGKLDAFVNGGGKVMICQIAAGTLANYNTILSPVTLTLSTPTERTRTVKCATSWLRRNSPRDLVRYGYLNIPNPFEMNTDPLLMGISNKDLDWTANQLTNGVKATGGSYSELIAPYRIDWTTMMGDRGEFTSPVNRSKSLMDWFQNRTPVLLKLNQGTNGGFWLINEMTLQNDAVRGKRIGNLLLTGMGASVGTTDIYAGPFITSIGMNGNQAINKDNLTMSLLGVYSNLGTKAIRVEYTLPENCKEIKKVSFVFFNISGRQVVKEISAAGFHAGKNVVQLDGSTMGLSKISRGVYTMKMSVLHKNKKQEHFYRQLSVL
jgi:beta-galactosidase